MLIMDEARAVKESEDNKLYLEEHNLQTYFEDAVTQMLSWCLENQSTNLKPTKFLKEYFCSVHQGTHVLFRDFSFVNSTPYNRLCAMKAVMQIFKPLLYREETLNVKDYHSLLQLVWADIPFDAVQTTFTSFEMPQQREELRLSFLEFIISMKNSFCVGDYDYEANIIDSQLNVKIDEFSKICKQGEKCTSNLSEADFLGSLEESGSDQASLWSVTSNMVQNTEFKRILGLKESNSFSSDEPVETCGKLSRSSSGSKDASKSDQNVSTFSRTSSASLCGRLSGKQLSNSLILLQTEKLDIENNFSTRRRHRSKSAVAIQRSYHHGRS